MRSIEEIRSDLDRASAAVQALRGEYDEAMLAASPVRLGDIVTARYGQERIDAKVTGIAPGQHPDRPRLTGVRRLKSGGFSDQHRSLYLYEVKP